MQIRFGRLVLSLCAILAAALPAAGNALGKEGGLPPGIFSRVEGEPVSLEEFRTYLDSRGIPSEKASRKDREYLAHEFLIDWKIARAARKRGLDKSPLLDAVIDEFDRKELPELYFRREIMNKTTVEEKDFEEHYIGLTDQASLRVAVLLTEDEGRQFRSLLGKGETFESLTARFSQGNAASRGGEITEVTPADTRFSLDEKKAIFAANAGDVLGPIPNRLGTFSVIKVTKRQTVMDRRKEIRQEKAQEVLEKKAALAYLSKLNEAMMGAGIEINEDYFVEGKKDGPQKPYLAWVMGKYIYPKDLGIDASGEPHSRNAYRKSLDKRIRAMVVADLARKAGMTELPEYKRKRDAYTVSTLVTLAMEEEYKKLNPEVTEKEIKEYYRTRYQPDIYALWVVMNADRTKVEKAREAVLAEGKPEDVAKEYSDDQSRLQGGRTAFYALSSFEPAVRKAISAVQQGELSPVFRTGEKFAIVKVVEKQHVPVPPLKDVRKKIRNNILTQKRGKMVEEYRGKVLSPGSYEVDLDRLDELK